MIITGNFRERELIVSPDKNYSFVIVPKNASTWTREYLMSGWDWVSHQSLNNYKLDDKDKETTLLITLRDPIDRWCSGITQVLFAMNYDMDTAYVEKYLKRVLFDKIQFDEHTELQCNFLHNINTANCIFFYMDNTYEKIFRKFCHVNFSGQHYSKKLEFSKNSSSRNEPRYNVKKLLESYCQIPENNFYIRRYYEKDYELINNVEFYGKKSS